MLISIISNKRIAQQCAIMKSQQVTALAWGSKSVAPVQTCWGARSNGKVNANGDRSSPIGNLAGE